MIIATHNPGKLKEMRELLAPYGIEAISAGEMGLTEPEETGTSFRANARIKADAAAQASGLPAFADNSGLVVDALDGAPGIHSARWAGADKNFGRAMETIERKLRERGATTPEQRAAHFVSALCVAWPDGHVEEFEAASTARWSGRRAATKVLVTIRCSCRTATTRTFGEMTSDEKHGLPPRGKGLSHRARAFLKLAEACLELTLTRTPDRPSASMSIGRSACRSAPIATSTAMCATAAIDEPRFVRAFAAEIAATAARVPGRTVSTIFFGGGTPSLMQPSTVGAVLDAIAQALDGRARRRGHARSQPDQRRGDALSRLSRGRRQPRVARRAGARRSRARGTRPAAHGARGARRGRRSRAAIFGRYSFDLIYARPRQTPQAWALELKRALAEAAEHLSLYQLTIEPDTPFCGAA